MWLASSGALAAIQLANVREQILICVDVEHNMILMEERDIMSLSKDQMAH
jgi:hypothetical protein